ncbi:DoxX family protein [Streptomyces bambusae]|uniref:DoxX family protein n=1 Tax=Streptomyces bambusae TaxID=1550616 RepID=UPI001CFCC34B|nr:DoxX family protein [Streptomyces bambusae]MCB5165767.1 DoxX family protein [Streptomyces bambusae]
MSTASAPARTAEAAVVPTAHAATLRAYDLGLLVLRLALGLTVAGHGVQKLFGWFGGGGISGTGKFFSSVGYPAGEAMAVVAGLTETLGGLGLALGLLTPLAGAAVAGTMVNALVVAWSGSFFVTAGGVEYEIMLLAAAVGLAVTGPGRYALDRFVPVVREHRTRYAGVALALAAVLTAATLIARA